MSADLERKVREAAEQALDKKRSLLEWTENAYLYGGGYRDGYLAATTLRQKEIERWKAEANCKDTVPRSRYNALNADWLDATRAIDNVRAIAKREIESRDAEIATLRARGEEMTAVLRTYLTDCGCGIPKPSDCDEIIEWINADRQNINDCCMGCREAAHLMVPPIQVPETKP